MSSSEVKISQKQVRSIKLQTHVTDIARSEEYLGLIIKTFQPMVSDGFFYQEN